MADKITRGAVELCMQVYDVERDAEKVDRVANPSKPSKKSRSKDEGCDEYPFHVGVTRTQLTQKGRDSTASM